MQRAGAHHSENSIVSLNPTAAACIGPLMLHSESDLSSPRKLTLYNCAYVLIPQRFGRLHCPMEGEMLANGKICDNNKVRIAVKTCSICVVSCFLSRVPHREGV